jgi:hypothetical protein
VQSKNRKKKAAKSVGRSSSKDCVKEEEVEQIEEEKSDGCSVKMPSDSVLRVALPFSLHRVIDAA